MFLLLSIASHNLAQLTLEVVAFQMPVGDILDKTRSGKKIITVLVILVAAVTTVMIVWTTNFWAVLAGKTIEGICSTIFLPAVTYWVSLGMTPRFPHSSQEPKSATRLGAS